MESVLDQLENPNKEEGEEEKTTPLLDPFAMSQCEFSDHNKSLYRIYENDSDYTLVEASTAAEAIQKADGKPHRVLRETMDNYSALPRNKVAEKEDGTVVYSDPELSEAGRRADFHTFDVSTYQADPTLFQGLDYELLAKHKENASLDVESGSSQVESKDTTAPAEETPAEAAPQKEEVAPDEEEELSAEQVAELLEEKE